MPFSWVFGVIVWLRHRFFDLKIFPAAIAPFPVISVGGIAAGGSGKTPVTDWVLKHLKKNKSATLMTRGYGRRTRGVVSHLSGTAPPDPYLIGDEAAMLWREHNMPIVAAERRVLGLKAVPTDTQVLLLDDAFSHRWLARDLDLVVLDPDQPFGTLLPAGMHREPVAELKRADVLWLFWKSEPKQNPDLELLENRFPDALMVESTIEFRLSWLKGGLTDNCAALCGIAKPQSFFLAVRSMDIRCDAYDFADHHRYTEKDLERVLDAGYQTLITTAKDWVKLERLNASARFESIAILTQKISLLRGEEALLKKLSDTVERRLPGQRSTQE